jgi:hypothetical protein
MDKKASCFVIMPFGGIGADYYARIYAPAISEAELIQVRADEVFRAGSILQDIVDLLSDSAIVLADISENNRNVHYELGLAHALGKPTVLVAHIDMPLFFDVGQERMVTYDKKNAFWGTDLRSKLGQAMQETKRNPETAIPTAFMHIKPSRIETDEVVIRLRRIDEQLIQIAQSAKAGPELQSRFRDILKSLPDAEAQAEHFLQMMEPKEAIRRLMLEGYREAMAESAVATAAARIRRST